MRKPKSDKSGLEEEVDVVPPLQRAVGASVRRVARVDLREGSLELGRGRLGLQVQVIFSDAGQRTDVNRSC